MPPGGGPTLAPAAQASAPSRPAGDRSRARLHLQGPAVALLSAAVVGVLWWLVDRDGPAVRLAGAAAIVVLVIADAVSAWRALAPVEVEVTPPRSTPADAPAPYLLRVPVLRRPVTVRLLAPGWMLPFEPVLLDSTDLTPVHVRTPARSIVDAQVFEARASGPLGLVTGTQRQRTRYAVPLAVVAPAERHRVGWPPMASRADGESVRKPRGEELFRSLRPYVRGDAMRSVHWPATAHHRQIMIRETEGIGTFAVRIIVAYESNGPAAEAAVARAAWVAREALAQQWTVDLVTCEPERLPGHPPLRPSGEFFLEPPPPGTRTVCAEVRSANEVDRRLAAAVAGTPAVDHFGGATRMVLPGGDQWR